MELGRKIKTIRLQHKIKQKELAYRIGISPSALTNWEKGRRKISIQWIEKIAVALDVPVGTLFSKSMPQHVAGDPQERRMLIKWKRLTPKKKNALLNLIEVL